MKKAFLLSSHLVGSVKYVIGVVEQLKVIVSYLDSLQNLLLLCLQPILLVLNGLEISFCFFFLSFKGIQELVVGVIG